MMIVILLISGYWVEASAQQLREAFARVKDSVAVVGTVEKDIAGSSQGGPLTSFGMGSGVLISADGKMFTAAHAVQTADRIGVQFEEGQVIPARVIASEPLADVALLQLEFTPPNAVVAKIGDSDAVQVGDEIFVIGAPLGMHRSLSAGHISARFVPKGSGGIDVPIDLFQTDASINAGNSGGPMFTTTGEVVGIVSYILSRSGGFEGLGFAATSNVARRLLLMEKSPWTGMESYLLSDQAAKILNVPQPYGVLVQRIAEGSPAARIGLRAGSLRAKIGEEELILGGDIILEVGGIPVAPEAYKKTQNYLLGLEPDTEFVVKALREGQVITLKACKTALNGTPRLLSGKVR